MPRLSGGELAFRAWEQALLFGAQLVFSQRATGLRRQALKRIVTLSGGSEVVARAVSLRHVPFRQQYRDD